MNTAVIALITFFPALLCVPPEYAIGSISNESTQALVIKEAHETKAILSPGHLLYLGLKGTYGVGCTILKVNSRHDGIYVHCTESNNKISVIGMKATNLERGQLWEPDEGFFQHTEKIEAVEGAQYTVDIAIKDSTLRKLECIIRRTK